MIGSLLVFYNPGNCFFIGFKVFFRNNTLSKGYLCFANSSTLSVGAITAFTESSLFTFLESFINARTVVAERNNIST